MERIKFNSLFIVFISIGSASLAYSKQDSFSASAARSGDIYQRSDSYAESTKDDQSFKIDQPMRLGRSLIVQSRDSAPVYLPEGTEFTVLHIDKENEKIRVGIDFAPVDGIPSEVEMTVGEMIQGRAKQMTNDDFATAEEAMMGGDDQLTYINTLIKTQISAQQGVVVSGRRRVGKTPGCYRDVKGFLLQRGLVQTRPPGGAAWEGYRDLTAQGWTDVQFSENLPQNAVCVSEGGKYSCGANKCGHIAVKTPSGWYGAGTFPHPLLRNHYNLRCLVAPQAR